jgi:hypothetical protein
MKTDIILTASGSLSIPQLNIALFDTAERAKVEASRIAAALSKSGYFNFYLYDVSSENHVQIATFKVEVQEPVVTVK